MLVSAPCSDALPTGVAGEVRRRADAEGCSIALVRGAPVAQYRTQ